jgi:2-dehydropantoate 2-reductase
MEINKISIIGLGALGIMFGSYIKDKVPQGALRIIADEERIRRYKNQGIYCNGKICDFTYLSGAEEDPADLLIFAVKFTQLEEAIATAAKQVGENTIIISTLNGISSEEYLAEAFGRNKVLLCTVQGMDAVKEDNKMVYHNMGYFSLGTWDGQLSPGLAATVAFFDRGGISYELPADMKRQLWNKLIINTGVNQSVAVYETDYNGVQQEGEARATMLLAMKEVVAVAQAMKIDLTEEDIAYWLKVLDSLAPDGMPSMRQDTLAHRPTEVELFSGTINRLGRQYQVATPVNEMLYRRIKEIEAGF